MIRVEETVGAFRQDRAPGLVGRLGAQAPLLPLTLRFAPTHGRPAQVMRFEIARLVDLTPALVEMVVANALLTADPGSIAGTIALHGAIEVGPLSRLPVEGSFGSSGDSVPAPFRAGRQVAGLVATLEGAPGGRGCVTAIDLGADILPAQVAFALQEIRLQRDAAAPGESVAVTATLRDRHDGTWRREQFEFKVPSLPRGTRLEVIVGDATAVGAAEGPGLLAAIGGAPRPDSVVRALSRLPAPDHLYLRITKAAAGVVDGPDPLPDLPPSVRAVLAAAAPSPAPTSLTQATVHAEERDLGAPVSGLARLTFNIE
jgi:hypothetical protein